MEHMRSKGRSGGGSGGGLGRSWWWQLLRLPAVLFLLCSFFLFAGFLSSTLVSQDDDYGAWQKSRLLELVDPGDVSVTTIPFQVISWKPRMLHFPGFASAEQCRSMMEMAKVHLAPSTLAFREGETANNTKGIRTSSGMFISASEDKSGVLGIIEEKIAQVTMISRTHGEAFNILRYEIGQKYNPHYDAFGPAEYGPQKSQRVASFLLYLSDVEEGGETMFPFENGVILDPTYEFRKCVGLKIKPRRGDGLLFYSLFPNGTIDPTSLHGSCPVTAGEKWVATKWLRDQELDYV